MLAVEVMEACLLAGLLRKPVLITSANKHHTTKLERQVLLAAQAFYGQVGEVHCKPETRESTILRELQLVLGPLVLFDIHKLSAAVQATLAGAIGSRIVVCTGDLNRISRPLRLVLSAKVAADLNDRVEPPEQFEALEELASKLPLVTIVPEVRVYIEDVVVFFRTSRLVKRGVPAVASAELETLVRAQCVLDECDFANPTRVARAAQLYFPLKIEVCDPVDEPSLQYGADILVVREWLGQRDVDLVVEDVLREIPVPV